MFCTSLWSRARLASTVLPGLALSCGNLAVAEAGGWTDDLQLHGFLSQGFVYTDTNRFFGPSDEGSWEFRELGANLSYQPKPSLLISGQVLSRTAGEMDDGGVRLDYGLVDFTPVMNQDMRAGIRLGRTKNQLGFYNDTRDVPFTRPSIFLPQSIYFDRVRNLELSSDGIGFYGDWQIGGGEFYLQVDAGRLAIDRNVEYAYLGGDLPGKLTTEDPWIVGRLLYESDGGRLRLAYSRAVGSMQYQPGLPDYLEAGKIDVDFWVLSAQYNTEDWSLTAEFMREPVLWRGFGVPVFERDVVGQGFYIQGNYRVAADWELVARYDISYLNKDDKNGSRQAAQSGVPAHNFYAKDLTLGVRWDLTSQLMLRAEYHRIRGTSWLSSTENDVLETEKAWDMFALQASFRF